MVQAAVFGYGTVGSGVVEVIETNQKEITRRAGKEISVKYVLDLRDFPGNPIQERIVHDVETILGDPEIAVICETMGGIEPAYTYSKRALMSGKSVCTSNKELVAAHGAELMRIAEENHCSYLFEASVGGGIPIIRTMNDALTAEQIDCIEGILNGTTNYILTKMELEGSDFDAVLKEAQELGYAERNPAADVEGYDACRKIAILSSILYGHNVNYEQIYTEGITKITPVDFAYAEALDCKIKLIGMTVRTQDGDFAMVSPRLVPVDSPIAGVNDVFNGIQIHSNMLDTSMYYGRGAGKLPTASAVVGDVVDCVKHLGEDRKAVWDEEEKKLTEIGAFRQQYFVRIKGERAAMEEQIARILGNVRYVQVPEAADEFGVLTEEISEQEYQSAAAKLEGICGMIRR
ncbi:MAG: homoserine dehydrogenase [Lachnospiraceae bacterium]|nr:homoserine dehydrogenase [Lachnospiraceae bacterium]